jgi:hypothetical protein
VSSGTEEVGSEVISESRSLTALVDAEDFSGGSLLGELLVEEEITIWLGAITSVHEAASHIFTMSGITFDHHSEKCYRGIVSENN